MAGIVWFCLADPRGKKYHLIEYLAEDRPQEETRDERISKMVNRAFVGGSVTAA